MSYVVACKINKNFGNKHRSPPLNFIISQNSHDQWVEKMLQWPLQVAAIATHIVCQEAKCKDYFSGTLAENRLFASRKDIARKERILRRS